MPVSRNWTQQTFLDFPGFSAKIRASDEARWIESNRQGWLIASARKLITGRGYFVKLDWKIPWVKFQRFLHHLVDETRRSAL